MFEILASLKIDCHKNREKERSRLPAVSSLPGIAQASPWRGAVAFSALTHGEVFASLGWGWGDTGDSRAEAAARALVCTWGGRGMDAGSAGLVRAYEVVRGSTGAR